MRRRTLVNAVILGVSVVALLLSPADEARAIPVFAHRFGLSCKACHSTIPHLTPFGVAFMRAGFRLPPGWAAHGAFPVAVKVNVQYASAPDPEHLPKVVLDELEFLAADSLSGNLSYRVEQYAVYGGHIGLTRDAWVSYTSRPVFGDARPALVATAGQFTLPLPDDPETQRPTLNHYAAFDQTVGSNPFKFFDDKIGVMAFFGKQDSGLGLTLAAVQGHDAQSGLPPWEWIPWRSPVSPAQMRESPSIATTAAGRSGAPWIASGARRSAPI